MINKFRVDYRRAIAPNNEKILIMIVMQKH